MVQHQHLTISNESIALSSVFMEHSIVRIDLNVAQQISTSCSTFSTSSLISPFGFCISGKVVLLWLRLWNPPCHISRNEDTAALSKGAYGLLSQRTRMDKLAMCLCACPGFAIFHLPQHRTILSSHPGLASKKHCSRTVRAAEIALHNCGAQLPLATG